MRCVTAKRLLLDRRDARMRPRAREGLAQHLRHCPACRQELAELNLLGEILGVWPDIEPTQEERQSVVNAMATEAGRSGVRTSPRRRSTVLVPVGALRLRYVLAAMSVLLVTWSGNWYWGGRPTYSSVTRALDNVPAWYASGTIYPAMFPSGNNEANRVEIWFRKPDTVRANIDGDFIQFLQLAGQRQLYFAPFKYVQIQPSDGVNLVRLFDVQEWLQEQAVGGVVPARLVGKMGHGPGEPRLLFELDVSQVLFGEDPVETVLVLVQVNQETMLPERVQTNFLGRDIWLEFDYTKRFPAEAEHLNLPADGVTVGDEILREVDVRLGE